MEWKREPAGDRQTWLEELGRRLVWSFPAAQVKDILSDYGEQFDEGSSRCKTEAEIIQGLGTPAEAAALLLEEEPAARTYRLRHCLIWGAVLAVCAAFFWVCFMSYAFGLFWIGAVMLLPVTASVLFLLLRGPARVALERPGRASRAAAYYVPAAMMLVTLLERQVLLRMGTDLFQRFDAGQMSEEAFESAGRVMRYGNIFFLLAVMLVLGLLTLWMLVRSVRRSARYFPGAVHAFGAMASVYVILTAYGSLYLENVNRYIYVFLLFYFAGLLTALTFQRWVDGKKPLPGFFQDGAATWPDWRHRLGVSLLGWFSAEQTLEVLEDYQEQYELGREQGKSGEALLLEMGRPETVVRDLLAEDRKARLNRRKSWPWAALAAVSGCLLLGLLVAFEFGGWGFGWFYFDRELPISLFSIVLGTVSLFFLLHARERAAVERRCPAPQKPSVWMYLPPLLASALVEGLSLWAVHDSLDYRTPVFLGQPLALYIVLSIEFSALLLTVLLIWTLARCMSGSILYLSAVPCIAGSMAQSLTVGMYLSRMDLSPGADSSMGGILAALIPCGAGVLLAAACWLVLRSAGRKEG